MQFFLIEFLWSIEFFLLLKSSFETHKNGRENGFYFYEMQSTFLVAN